MLTKKQWFLEEIRQMIGPTMPVIARGLTQIGPGEGWEEVREAWRKALEQIYPHTVCEIVERTYGVITALHLQQKLAEARVARIADMPPVPAMTLASDDELERPRPPSSSYIGGSEPSMGS